MCRPIRFIEWVVIECERRVILCIYYFSAFFRGTQARSAFVSCAVCRYEVESKNANLIVGV